MTSGKQILAVTLAIASIVIVGSMLLGGSGSRDPTGPAVGPRTVVLRSVPSPRLTARQIDRQDPPDARRQRAEAVAFDRRPLLNALPAIVQGVRLVIGGLARDQRTTIIHAHARGLSRRRARIAFETLKRRTGDRSSTYRLQIVE